MGSLLTKFFADEKFLLNYLYFLMFFDFWFSRSSTVDCGEPKIVNGYLDRDWRAHGNTTVGGTAIYKCYHGYVSDDPVHRDVRNLRVATCQPSGHWSLAKCRGKYPWQMIGTDISLCWWWSLTRLTLSVSTTKLFHKTANVWFRLSCTGSLGRRRQAKEQVTKVPGSKRRESFFLSC